MISILNRLDRCHRERFLLTDFDGLLDGHVFTELNLAALNWFAGLTVVLTKADKICPFLDVEGNHSTFSTLAIHTRLMLDLKSY